MSANDAARVCGNRSDALSGRGSIAVDLDFPSKTLLSRTDCSLAELSIANAVRQERRVSVLRINEVAGPTRARPAVRRLMRVERSRLLLAAELLVTVGTFVHVHGS